MSVISGHILTIFTLTIDFDFARRIIHSNTTKMSFREAYYKFFLRLGYIYSYDGKKSRWQKAETAKKIFQDIKKKYPWL